MLLVVPGERVSVDVCRICEKLYHTDCLEIHSELCAGLQQLDNGNLSVDAQLTIIAQSISEDMEGYVGHLRSDHRQLAGCTRLAASLQPDGSKIPVIKCLSVVQVRNLVLRVLVFMT